MTKEAAMLIQDCMTRDVVTASPGTSVLVARRLLASNGIRHLPIVTGDHVVGIVSDRDVRINDRELAASLSALHSDLVTGRYRRLASVMTAPAHVIGPKMKVATAALFMVSRRIGALPVVDDGKLVGIISLTDCVRALAAEAEAPQTKAAEPSVPPGPAPGPTTTPMPSGDARPGRPQPVPSAVVVDPSAGGRMRARTELAAAGYVAATCPGPGAGAYCPALHAPGSRRCPRVPEDAALVLLHDDTYAPALREAYARWLPEAVIRTTRA
jgi:CBS domain-containing protein